MCGIAGFYDTTRNSSREILVRITDLLSYRGPDDSGYEFRETPHGHLGLGHRRLSIIDLSPLGNQPMTYDNLSITFNGEVYNFLEIRKELDVLGYKFESTSDTEVILKAIHKWGVEAVNRFNGMFSMAIYDSDKDELTFVRDRMGVKPLYYFYDGQNIAFASELKPLMQYPLSAKCSIDLQALNSFIYHGYIDAPKSIFENIFKLEPGSYLKYRQGRIEVKRYWSIEEAYKKRVVNESISENDAIDRLDELITSSVRYRMISDVPIGSFLSGGIDSSLVSAVMQKLSPGPINTFTIGFNEPQYDESVFAKKIAEHLKTSHHEQTLPIKQAQSFIGQIPHYYDEPFADSSQIPTMLVSQLARKNVTVALSGDGGDEFFCGYKRYSDVFKFTPFKLMSKFGNLFRILPGFEKGLGALHVNARKLLYINSTENIINRSYLFSRFYLSGLIKNNHYELNRKYFDVIGLSPENIQEAYMLQDMITYLPDDILTKVDRATMSSSLEGREPLLDYRLIEFSFSLPHHLKFKNGVGKYLLKELAYRYIPKKLLDRPKMGFGVPVYQWLQGELNFLIKKYLSKDFILKQGIFDANQVAYLVRLFETNPQSEFFAKIIWHTLVFQMWHEKYVQQRI